MSMTRSSTASSSASSDGRAAAVWALLARAMASKHGAGVRGKRCRREGARSNCVRSECHVITTGRLLSADGVPRRAHAQAAAGARCGRGVHGSQCCVVLCCGSMHATAATRFAPLCVSSGCTAA
jgi:hypothetical protein